MKKVLFVLMMAICTSLFSSFDGVLNNVLKQRLEQAREGLPMQIDEGLVMDDITLGDNGIVYHITVSEELYDMDILKENAPEVKKGIIADYENTINDDQELKEFLEAAVELNKPLNYKYEGNTSGNIVRIKISPNDIKEVLESKD